MASKSPPGDPPRNGQGRQRSARCPICGAPTEASYRPFCSRRCADVDLSRWLRGGYAIPGRADVDEDGDDTAAASGVQRDQRPNESSDDDPS
ncbi:MAG: DNA gyrase inhibitor YacG [Hyphomicrobiaceae bacterium]